MKISAEQEIGTVLSLEGGFARVLLETHEACSSCSARVICRPGEGEGRSLLVKSDLPLQPGDRVIIARDDRINVFMALIQFGIPLVFFLVGLLGVQLFIKESFIINRDLLSFLVGVALLISGGLLSRWIFRVKTEFFASFLYVAGRA